MTIKEIIIAKELESSKERLALLEEMDAPEVIIVSLDKHIERLTEGQIEVGGDSSLLELEYISHVTKKGNGGKPYVVFNDSINYFPQAKFGRYITAK